jgi:hypothetical protein
VLLKGMLDNLVDRYELMYLKGRARIKVALYTAAALTIVRKCLNHDVCIEFLLAASTSGNVV